MYKNRCGKPCAECKLYVCPCELDSKSPCHTDCKNLMEDGSIKIFDCLQDGCDAIFSMIDESDGIVHLRDWRGNSGTIQRKRHLPDREAPAHETCYVLTLTANYDPGFDVPPHVSVHPTFHDALKYARPDSVWRRQTAAKLSHGTFEIFAE